MITTGHGLTTPTSERLPPAEATLKLVRDLRGEIAQAIDEVDHTARFAVPISSFEFVLNGAERATRLSSRRAAHLGAARRGLEAADEDLKRVMSGEVPPAGARAESRLAMRRSALQEAAALRLAA